MSTTSTHIPIDPTARSAITAKLLRWYRLHQRDLPWRGRPDAYGVWVSEIMLQQTRVATVRSYYERWMRCFPTPSALAQADASEVMRCWEGLGYYSRARNLQKAAQLVVQDHAGQLPREPSELQRLPGIGRYSAGAIASIAHGQRCAAVDGNVIRVLSRLFRIGGDPKRASVLSQIWQVAEQLLPKQASRAGDFNQALMELGASHCAPRSPQCVACPLSQHCQAYRHDLAEEYPQVGKRPAPTQLYRVALALQHGRRWLVHRLPADAQHWRGMWIFPQLDIESQQYRQADIERWLRDEFQLGIGSLKPVARMQHHITRFKIQLQVLQAEATTGPGRRHDHRRWLAAANLSSLAMPAPHRRIANHLHTNSST